MKQILLTAVAMAATFWSCGGGAADRADSDGDTVTSQAALLTIVEHQGWVEAAVADPWQPGRRLASYALVSGDSAVDVPVGFTRVTVPLRRSIVYSAIHLSAIHDLGATGAVAAVADGDWLADSDPFKARVAAGVVADIGSSMSPSVETAIAADPDAVLLSPFENGARGGIEKCGAPIVEMADYMEQTPTGRAEWLLLVGYLYGSPDRARCVYDSVCARYDSVRGAVARATAGGRRPRVFSERPMSGVWYVPGGESYMARLIADAGGEYVWADESGSGSLPLDEAAVIDRASDADIWLLKEYGGISADRLAASVPHPRAFKAFPGGVRVCDTRVQTLYSDLAFYPDRVLADLAAVFAGADSARYFKPLPR